MSGKNCLLLEEEEQNEKMRGLLFWVEETLRLNWKQT